MSSEIQKVEMLEKKKRIRRKPNGRFKILGVLAAANDYLLLWELTKLAGYSEVYCMLLLDQLWRSGYVEKIARGFEGNLWRITENGRQEYRESATMFGVVPVEKQSTMIVRTEAHRQYLSRQKRIELRQATQLKKDARWIDEFSADKALRANESGLRKYFLYDPNSPIDMEIVKRVRENTQEEYYCKRILCKRLALSCSANYRDVDQVIEIKLLDRCKKKGITRNEFVRQLFCIHLNIKIKEAI